MREWAIAPVVVLALCALWTWLANRRPRRTGVVWPEGFSVAGSTVRPTLGYPRDVVLGCEGNFRTIECRVLTLVAGADVKAELIIARKLVVMSGASLCAEELRVQRLVLEAGSRTTALVIGKPRKVKRHPTAIAKGFYADRQEAEAAGAVRAELAGTVKAVAGKSGRGDTPIEAILTDNVRTDPERTEVRSETVRSLTLRDRTPSFTRR